MLMANNNLVSTYVAMYVCTYNYVITVLQLYYRLNISSCVVANIFYCVIVIAIKVLMQETQ